MKGKEMFLPPNENFSHDKITLKNGFIIHDNGQVDTPDITMSSFYDTKRIAYLSSAIQVGKMFSTYRALTLIKEQLFSLPLYALEDLPSTPPTMTEKEAFTYVEKNGFTKHYNRYTKWVNPHLGTLLFPESFREANRFITPEFRTLTYQYAALTSCLELNSWVTKQVPLSTGQKPEFGTPYLSITYGPPIIPYPTSLDIYFRPRYLTLSIKIRRFGISDPEIQAVTNFYEGSNTYIMPIFDIPKSLHKNVLYKVHDGEVHNLNKKVFHPYLLEEYNEYNFRTAFYHVAQRQRWNTSAPDMLTRHYTSMVTWDDIVADLNVPYEQWRDKVKKTVDTNIATLWKNYEQWIAHIRTTEDREWDSTEDILAKGEILAEDERLKESLKIVISDHNKIVQKLDKAESQWLTLSHAGRRI